MRKINIKKISCFSCILILVTQFGFAQFNISGMGKKIAKETEKKIDKSIDKKIDKTIDKADKALDIKIENSTSNKTSSTTPQPTANKSTMNTNTNTETSGLVPQTSSAYLTWTNYDKNMKTAQKAQAQGDKYSLKQYVGYCEKQLAEMKKKDPSIDYSAFDAEVAVLKAEVTTNAAAAKTAANREDYLKLYIDKKRTDYKSLYETQEEIKRSSRNSDYPIPSNGKKYYEIASGFHIDSVIQAIEEYKQIKKTFPTYNGEYLTAAFPDYENYIEYSGMLPYVKKLAGQSYEELKKNNTEKAIELAEQAQGYCKGALIFSPDNQKVKDALVMADKAYTNAAGSAAKALSSTSTGDFHKKHLNQIVWSTKKLTIGSESESDISTSFKSGQTIYGTIYLPDLVGKLLTDPSGTQYILPIKIDGESMTLYHQNQAYIFLTEEMKQKSTIQFALVPALTDDFSVDVKNKNGTIVEFNKNIIEKAPMSYKISMVTGFKKLKADVIGEFEYDLSDGTDYNQKVINKIEDIFAEAVRLPAAKMKNPALEAQMTAFLNEKASDKGQKYSNCRILESDWRVTTNTLGIILLRSIDAAFVATYPDGHCELLNTANFVQDYQGGGQYSKGFTNWSLYGSKRMNCANINK